MKKQLFILISMCLIVFLFSLTVGSYHLGVKEIIDVLFKTESPLTMQVFYQLRLPRVLMGLLAGMVLGIAGGVYQLVFTNPLASPDVTGVASGSSLGAACAIVLGAGGTFEIMFGAFISGMISLLFVMFLVKVTRVEHTLSYILAGMIISALSNAGLMMLKYIANPVGELAAIEFWTMGSLASIQSQKALIAYLCVSVPLVFVLLSHRHITLLSLGDENAIYLGMNVKMFRAVILTLTTLMVSVIIAVCGVISFVGLIAPHIAYFIIKKRTQHYLLVSGMIGGFIILVADICARSFISHAEMPLSILTILFSTPILLIWMIRRRGY